MSNIVRFKTPQDNTIEAIEYILEQAKQGNIDSFAFAAQLTDGNVATSYAHADVGTKQKLIGHLQADVMYQVIQTNMDRLVEYV